MGAFVAGSHELSPSINYLLHNKIYSGQRPASPTANNGSNNNNNNNSSEPNDTDSQHLESSSSATSSVSNKIDISNGRNKHHQQQQLQQRHHHFHEVLPPLPPIKGEGEGEPRRLPPLTIEEYERDYREQATDLKLVERVYLGGLASDRLRAALWPYLFGLVKRRGRFVEATGGADQQAKAENLANKHQDYLYVEHEENLNRWQELERLYYGYQQQWKSITGDQERRFSSFRERKSLIERDVIRSDRSHPFYAGDKLENLTNLSTLLMTYMMYDFDIGYLQGMSDLAAPILYVYGGDLVKAFWVFVEMMKLFRRNFEFSQKTIHFQLNCLYRLVKMTDPKFGQFLKRADCSNCFFAFRCIVCQFKRELMRQDNDYDKVLRLWDTIWCVQRRHELRARNKVTHTYTISGQSSSSRRAGWRHNNSNGHHLHRSPTRQPLRTSWETNGGHVLSNSYNGRPLSKHGSPSSDSCHLANGIRAANNLAHRRSSSCIVCQHQHQQQQQQPRRQTSASRLSSPQRQDHCHHSHHHHSHHHHMNHHHLNHHLGHLNPHCKPAQVKQEQVIYTRETFYSSFDPDQADVPRFELTETEKFVLALCLSLIRRDRNQILQERLDATEIHQHFIAPRLAQDLDGFVEQAYHIYHYLNTDCDLQLLVKGANGGWSITNAPSSLSDPSSPLQVANGQAAQADDMADTADTYDLLRDYLIISPSSHESSFGAKQRHWDYFLNNNPAKASR